MSLVLEERGWGHLTDWVFVLPSVGAMCSPLFMAALADQRFRAEKLMALVLLANGLMTGAAFWCLHQGFAVAFLVFLVLKALLGAPAWPLLMSVTLSNLKEPEREFGGVRVWGTVGWMMAGWSISALALDRSFSSGFFAMGLSFAAAVLCLFLPSTPPSGKVRKRLRDVLGFSAFKVLKNREVAVYFATAAIFAIPVAAYYPYTSKFLGDLGVQRVALVMSLGQTTEIVGMLLLGWIFRNFRVKWTFLVALGSGFLRYLFYGFNGCGAESLEGTVTWVVMGILLHGVCWTFFFESGKLVIDRRVPRELRAQTQALMSVLTGGLAMIVGVLFSGWLYRFTVVAEQGGWERFWAIQSGICLIAIALFAIGYRVQKVTRV